MKELFFILQKIRNTDIREGIWEQGSEENIWTEEG
jgi:hypothetical protein